MITYAYPCTCFWHQNPDILLTYIIHFSCPNIVQNTMLFSCPVQNFKMIKWLSNFSTSLEYTLAIEYDVYIWQVSPRVSCGDTCQIWLCFKDQKATFARSNTLLTEKLKSEALTQYHGCWCPGSLRRQDISSNDIDFVEYVGPGLIWGRILSTCVISMWSNGMKCKYMFMFPLQNLAIKELITSTPVHCL